MKKNSVKSIKYIYHKRKVKNLINKKKTSDISLCFMSQGLNSKEFFEFRSLMGKLDLDLLKVSRRSWTKVFSDSQNRAFGDLYILQNKSNKPWLFFLYHQILNYSSYRVFNKKFHYNIKSDNLNIDSVFDLNSPQNSIKEFMNFSLVDSLPSKGINKSKFIYPWECISSEENQPDENYLSNIQSYDNYASLLDKWFEKEGYPMNVLMSYIGSNNIQFLGCLNPKKRDFSYIEYDNYLMYNENDLGFDKRFSLKSCILNHSKNFGDSYFLKLSPLNLCYIVYL